MKPIDHSRLAGAAALLLLCSASFAQQTRTEKDLLGDKQIPAAAYYGVQTARALENFPISGVPTKFYPDYVKAFAIAGADKKFVWATATINGNTIVVQSPKVESPVAVRYAWGNNPDDANLYNKSFLPASPFRTDEWPGETVGKSDYGPK